MTNSPLTSAQGEKSPYLFLN